MSWSSLVSRGAALLGAAALAVVGYAHVRLLHPGTGTPLFWSDPTSIGIVIPLTGSDDVDDQSEVTALRCAIDAWNSATGTTALLVEDSSPESRSRTDWENSAVHMFWFDEDNSSGYFPSGSGTVAITPVWFYSSGMIDDADILFNGGSYSFTTRGEDGAFDIQDVAAHELGHLLGLDHSGAAGSTMYPYVDPSVILHRSISVDDEHGLRGAYPSDSFASISGTVIRASDDSRVAGAHVVVRDSDGRTVSATLASVSGDFTLPGLDAGAYELYATPLDYPVGRANLGSGWTIETDFESTVFGDVTVTAGAAITDQKIVVGADVPLSLGGVSDHFPLRCEIGSENFVVVTGRGLTGGSSLIAGDGRLTVTPVSWFGSGVTAKVSVPAGVEPGHSDLVVTDPFGEVSILVAGLEFTPSDPVVLMISPNQAEVEGGKAVTLTGANFNEGARVVLGGQIYVDGESDGCTVVNDSTITLTTKPSLPGITDVVVIDPTGVEGRRPSSFQFLAVPEITTVFPSAGSAAGGTLVTLQGENFVEGVLVRIAGAVQANMTLESNDTLTVITEPGTAGGPYILEVVNPGGAVATAMFRYSNQPDPVVTAITPAQGTVEGGDVVTISGSGFTENTVVLFGADAVTGQGGAGALDIQLVDAHTLNLTTPAGSLGEATVLVTDFITGQADTLTPGFTFVDSDSGGEGGGCHAVPVQGPPDPRDVAYTLVLMAVMALGASRCAHRPRRVVARRSR